MLSPRLLTLARSWLQGVSLWTYAEPFLRDVREVQQIEFRRGAVRRGHRLCRPHAGAAHPERRAACRHAASGMVHLDGPGAAVGSAGARTPEFLPTAKIAADRRRASSIDASSRPKSGRWPSRDLPSSTRNSKWACDRSPSRSATARQDRRSDQHIDPVGKVLDACDGAGNPAAPAQGRRGHREFFPLQRANVPILEFA